MYLNLRMFTNQYWKTKQKHCPRSIFFAAHATFNAMTTKTFNSDFRPYLCKGELRLYKTCRNPALSWTVWETLSRACAMSTFYLWHWMQKACVVRAAGKGGPVCCINALLVDTSSSLRMNPWPGTPMTSGYQKRRPGIAQNCGGLPRAWGMYRHRLEIKRRGIFLWAALSLAPPRAGWKKGRIQIPVGGNIW